MTPAFLNAIGQAMSLVGVIILFRYGMPFRVSAGGGDIVITKPTEENIQENARYRRLGFMGLFLVLIGGAIQIAVNFWPSN